MLTSSEEVHPGRVHTYMTSGKILPNVKSGKQLYMWAKIIVAKQWIPVYSDLFQVYSDTIYFQVVVSFFLNPMSVDSANIPWFKELELSHIIHTGWSVALHIFPLQGKP